MPDYDTSSLGRGVFAGLNAFAEAKDEQKTRAREFKALQEFADATGIAAKDQTTVLDLESLKGLVRGGEAKRAQQEQQRKAQMEQAQFDALQKHRQTELSRGLGNDAWRMFADVAGMNRNAKTDARLDRNLTLDEDRARRIEADRKAQQDREGRFFDKVGEAYRLNESMPGAALPVDAQRLATFAAETRGVTPQGLIQLQEFADKRNDPDSRFRAETERLNAMNYRAQVENSSPWSKAISGWAKPATQARPIEGMPGYMDFGGKPYPIKPDSAAGPDPQLAGALAELLEMKKRGVKEAKLGEGGKVHEGGMMTFGEQPIDEVIARVRAQLGGTGAAVASPAAAGDDKVVVEKDGKKFKLPKGQLEDAKRQGYKLSQ